MLLHGDCLDLMATLPDASVDLVLTDPPYGTVKNAPKNWTVGGEAAHEWDEALEPSAVLRQCNRLMRPNGALILFSQEPYTSRLTLEARGSIAFAYRMTWVKNDFANALGCNKAPVSYTEDVCVFFKSFETFLGHPLKPWFDRELESAGLTRRDAIERWGSSASHYFTDGHQFRIPTAQKLAQMQADTGRFQMCHGDMRAIADEFQARFPRVFNLPEGKKYKSNVLQYRKDYDGYHPTQKPVALLEDLVKTYSNPGDTVLDFTMGSGSTGVACANTGRKFIGIERDDKYFAIASERINGAQMRLAA